MTLKLGTYRDYNYTDEEFWKKYKVGKGDLMDDVLDFTLRRVNMTIEFITSNNITYEKEELQRKLKAREIDVLVAQLVPNPYFYVNYTITSHYTTAFTAILSSDRSTTSEPVYTVFFSLSLKAWLCVVSHIIAISIIRTISESKKSEGRSFARSFFDQIWNNCFTFVQKPQHISPKTLLSKLVLVLLLIEAVIVQAFYNGNLQAGYVDVKSEVINTLEELINSNLKITISASSPARGPILYLSSKVDKYENFLKRITVIEDDKYDQMVDNGTLLADVLSGKCVIIDVIDNLMSFVYNSTDPFWISRTTYFPVPVLYLTKKNISKSIMNRINKRITRFVETQQRTPYDRTLNLLVRKDNILSGNTPDPLNLNDLEPIFILLVTGGMISTLVLFVEFKFIPKCFKPNLGLMSTRRKYHQWTKSR